MNASIWMDGIRNLFSVFDKLIYFLIEWSYELLMKLAEVQIFQEGQITEFATRVYSLLGIFMLFKVSFSLINYLVNPDSLTDNKSGGSQIVKRILITLILIIVVPMGFDLIYRAQSAILTDQLLPQFILGTTGDSLGEQTLKIDPVACEDRTLTSNGGAFIALLTFKPFYQLYDYDGEIGFEDDQLLNVYCQSESVADLLSPTFHQAEVDRVIFPNTGSYAVDYQMLWSTIVGVVVLLLLISFCFDAAVRTIKLGFLEIIAPIPIISYINPQGGNGGPFNKWLKEVGRTWASLFIRLAAVFFAIYIIRIVNENYNNNIYGEDMWLMLFLIIGALMFAKKLPRLIEDILGIKLEGSLQLNPFKKISNEALGGKALVGLPGKAMATTIGAGVAVGGLIGANRRRKLDLNQKNANYDAALEKANLARNERNIAEANYLSSKAKREAAETERNSIVSAINQKNAEAKKSDSPWESHMLLNEASQLTSKAKQQQLEVDKFQTEEASLKAKFDQADAEFQSAEIKSNEAKIKADRQKEENEESFSYRNPTPAAILQALRGAKFGLDEKGTNNLAHAIAAGINAAKKAATARNNYERFGLLERMRDLGSDITGVKNASGTSSEIGKAIKEQNEYLNDIRNNIATLQHALANVNPQAIDRGSHGEISINNNYSFAPGERESVQYMIDQYNGQRQAEKDTAKQIKEFQEVLDSKGKKDK